MLTTTGGPRARSRGNCSVRNCSTPSEGMPMALSIPQGVSQILGGGLPVRGSRKMVLLITAPSSEGRKNPWWTSATS